MTILKYTSLKDFDYDDIYSFQANHFFEMPEETGCLILNAHTGTSIFLEKGLIDVRKKHYGISKDSNLFVKLLQRGMIVDKSRKIFDCNRIIRPNFFLIDITKSCNLNCCYCFRNLEDKRTITNDILDTICKKIEENCIKNHIPAVTIQPWGGEPLLAIDKIERIYHYFQNTPIRAAITIETNGTLIDDSIIKRLKSIDAHIGISVDGCEEIHEKQRPFANGMGSFLQVKRGIKLLQEAGFTNISIISVLTKSGIPFLEKSFDSILKDLRIKNFKFNLVHNSSFKEEKFDLEESDIDRFCETLFKQYTYWKQRGCKFSELNIDQRVDNILERDDSNICLSNGCQGGNRMLSFSMDGNIYPCELIDYPSDCLGSVYDETNLNDSVKNKVNAISYFQNKSVEGCKDCPWHYFCKGGCTSSLIYSGGKDVVDKTTCRINKVLYPMIIEWILKNLDKYVKTGDK